jgi:hypothetical protein
MERNLFMQIKLPPKNIEMMLKNSECEISYRSKNLLVAKKTFDYGMIHIRLKRQKVNYVLKERYYWLANIHFEKGTRPQRLFESNQVIEFIEKYVEPYYIQ